MTHELIDLHWLVYEVRVSEGRFNNRHLAFDLPVPSRTIHVQLARPAAGADLTWGQGAGAPYPLRNKGDPKAP